MLRDKCGDFEQEVPQDTLVVAQAPKPSLMRGEKLTLGWHICDQSIHHLWCSHPLIFSQDSVIFHSDRDFPGMLLEHLVELQTIATLQKNLRCVCKELC